MEGVLAFRSPRELLWLAFEGVVEMIEVRSGATDVASVVPYHTKKSLEFLDRGGGFCGSNCFDFVGEWDDAVLVDVEAEEVELGDAEDAFCAVDHEAVFGEEIEDLLEVGHVLLG